MSDKKMAMTTESAIDTSDSEEMFDSEGEPMYGEGYVSRGGKAPRCGIASLIDVQTAGSLDNVSMKESVTGTKVTTDTKMETEAELKREEPPARTAKPSFARSGRTGGVRKPQLPNRLRKAVPNANNRGSIGGPSRFTGRSTEESKSHTDYLIYRIANLESDSQFFHSFRNKIVSRVDALHLAIERLEDRVKSSESWINEYMDYKGGEPEEERMIIPRSHSGDEEGANHPIQEGLQM